MQNQDGQNININFLHVLGVTHNIPLLRDILTEKNFVEGNISTNYLSEVYPDGFKGKQLTKKDRNYVLAVAASIYAKMDIRSYIFLNEVVSTAKHKEPSHWKMVLQLFGEEHSCEIKKLNGKFQVRLYMCTHVGIR